MVLEWEGKMGRGELGVLFVCFFHPIVVLACVSDLFSCCFCKNATTNGWNERSGGGGDAGGGKVSHT